MRVNPFEDSWLFLIGAQPDQMSLGAWRWLFVLLFTSLLVANVALAVHNLSSDVEQRRGPHFTLWLLRTLVGTMWFQGMLWKLPLFSTHNGLYFWTKQMAEFAAFPIYAELVNKLLLPYFTILTDPLVFLAELTFATSLMLGFGVRVTGALGMLFVLNLWIGLYRQPQEWPWTYIFLAGLMGLFSVQSAGRSLGLDAWLLRRPGAHPGGLYAFYLRYLA